MERGMVPEARKWPWLKNNVHYETIMGSMAYGCADTSVKDKPADFDVYGFAFPPKQMMFPHLAGHLIMFGQKKKKGKSFVSFGPAPEGFEQMQSHHIMDNDALGGQGKEYDLNIFNIVKFFQLCLENNPNMVDSLFTPENMVIHCTNVGRVVRDNRKLFLSKLCWVKFRGYAHTQLKKMNDKEPQKVADSLRDFESEHGIDHATKLSDVKKEMEKRGRSMTLENLTDAQLTQYYRMYDAGQSKSSRFQMVKIHQYDIKFAYHIIRLFDEVEQILVDGDIDLQRAREMMKSIRRGEWKADEVRDWAMVKERELEKAYANCKLPEVPDFKPIEEMLFNCIEDHYGSLENCVEQVGWSEDALKEIDGVLDKHRRKLYS